MANESIRIASKSNNIQLWRVADEMGISEASFTRLMRKELSEEKKKEIISIIQDLARGAENDR